MSTFLFLVLAVFVIDCYRRIGNIERTLRRNKMMPTAPSPVLAQPGQSGVPLAPAVAPSVATDTATPKLEKSISSLPWEDKESNFLGDNWMIKVGVLLVVLSMGWFVTYAFTHDWIGPIGRVTLGMLFGITLLVVGTWRFSQSSVQGLALLSGGVASLYISIFSGMSLYAFYSPLAGLALMSLVTLYMAVLSGVRRSRELSVATLVTGLIAPLFVWSEVGIAILFLYLFVLSLGVIIVDVFSGWRATTLFSLLGVFLYSLVSYANGDIERTFLHFLMVLCFVILFYIANIGAIAVTRSVKEYDLALSALVGFSLFSWIVMTVDSDFVGMVFIIMALLFAISSYAFSVFYRLYAPMLMYAVVSLGFLLSATAKIFDGSALTVLLAVEMGGLAIASFFVFREKNFQVGKVLSLLLVWPVLLSLENIGALMVRGSSFQFGLGASVPTGGEIAEHLFVLAVLIGVFGLLAFFGQRFLPKSEKGESPLTDISKWVSFGYILLFIWFLLHNVIPQYYVASMIGLILFTGVGLYCYVQGILRGVLPMKRVGTVLFVIVLIRLFLVEFWTMSAVEKIITSFVVGALFLSTAFLLQKTKSDNPDTGNVQ
jgi:uncharacterized membrane protein